VYRRTIPEHPFEPTLACIALSNRVCSKQPEVTALPQKDKSPPKEVGHEVGVFVCALMYGYEPEPVGRPEGASYSSPAKERRIADEGIEPAILTGENFREF
jgi:hypothetical protein